MWDCIAAAFASRGFEVIGIDIDAQRVDTITSRKVPLCEPGLRTLLKKALRTGRFRATTDTTQSSLARFIFITVGTPSSPDGSIDQNLCHEFLDQCWNNSSRIKVLVLRLWWCQVPRIKRDRTHLEENSHEEEGPPKYLQLVQNNPLFRG